MYICIKKYYVIIYLWKYYEKAENKRNLYTYTRCTSMKWRFFFQKKHVKFGRMIKRDLFKVCSIASYTFFPSFGQFVNTTSVKIFPFCREHSSSYFFTSSYEPKRTKRCSASVMQTSGNRKKPSLVSKPHGVELSSWMLPRVPNWFCRMWWSIVMEKNDLVLPLLVFWSFFKQRTVQIDQLLLSV